MSGQDDKFGLMDEAEVQYKRLGSLLARAGNPELPADLKSAMDEFNGRGNISTSMSFSNALRKQWDKIGIADSLKPELGRIAKFNESLTGYSEEAKAQLSADRIHLYC